MRLSFWSKLLVLFAFTLTLAMPWRAWAQPAASAAPETPFAWKLGPEAIELGHELTIDLPAKIVFLGMPDAGKLLEKNGNFDNQDLLGVVTVATEDDDPGWFAVIRYSEEGYVKDDEKIDADELLKAFREGQEEANKVRVERGFSALTIDGWAEQPHYDRAQHHLVWAVTVGSADHGKSVNYNTRVLGRRGFVSINLITDPELLAKNKPNAAMLLDVTKFKAGSRYADFNEKTDKVAEYGLVGLILGGAGLGAAKLVKVGLLAKFGKVIIAGLIAGKKFIVVALAGAAALLKRFLSGKKEQS